MLSLSYLLKQNPLITKQRHGTCLKKREKEVVSSLGKTNLRGNICCLHSFGKFSKSGQKSFPCYICILHFLCAIFQKGTKILPFCVWVEK